MLPGDSFWGDEGVPATWHSLLLEVKAPVSATGGLLGIRQARGPPGPFRGATLEKCLPSSTEQLLLNQGLMGGTALSAEVRARPTHLAPPALPSSLG